MICKRLLPIAIIFLLVVNIAFAQELTASQKTYIDKAKSLVKIIQNLEGRNNPSDAAVALYFAGNFKKAAGKYDLTEKSPGVKETDDALRNGLGRLVSKYKVTSKTINSLIAEAQKTAPSGVVLKNVDINIHKNPILYSSSILPSSVPRSAQWIIYIIVGFVGLNLIRMIFNPNARNLAGLFGAGLFSWFGKTSLKSIPFLDKITDLGKKEGEINAIEKTLKEKEGLVRENQENLQNLLGRIKDRKTNKEDPGKLWDESDFENKWKETTIAKLKLNNKQLKDNLKRYYDFLKTFEKGFQRRMIATIKNDLRAILRLQKGLAIGPGGVTAHQEWKNPVEELRSKVEEIKQAITKEAVLMNEKFFPKLNLLANIIRKLRLTTDVIEKNILEREEDVLERLSKGAIFGRNLAESLEFLKEVVRQKTIVFAETKQLIMQIIEIEKEFGDMSDIKEETIRLKRTVEVTDEMRKSPRYNPYKKTSSPLVIKEGPSGIPVKNIEDVSMLKIMLTPKTSSAHDKLSIEDDHAYQLFQKQKSGKSELYTWLSEQCNNPELAKEIERMIEEQNLPAEIEYEQTIKQVGRRQEISTFPKNISELIVKLNKIRKRAVEAIDDAYPPLK